VRRWLISVPAWGDEFTARFGAIGLPMLRAAAARLNDDRKLIVHTDRPEMMEKFYSDVLPVEVRPVPGGQQWFHSLSRAHREVISMACIDDVVVFLTADMTVSENALTACGDAFQRGKRLVCCNATRAIDEGLLPHRPSSRALSEWGWFHRHDMTKACTWPTGTDEDLPRVYFERGGNVVARLYLPHPLAVVIDGRPLHFAPTVDCDLIANFEPEEIHMVTSPDELAALELSPRSKLSGSRDAHEPPARPSRTPMPERYANQNLGHRIYRWAVSHRVVVCGASIDCGDADAVAQLLRAK
jgi:hypothetical protein